jgi:hypothetical protein
MNTPNTIRETAYYTATLGARATPTQARDFARAASECSHAIAALRSVDASAASTYTRCLRAVVAVGTVETLRALRGEIDATYRATVAR